MYTSYRRDRADGWGGVIIITKKNLTVEEIKINKDCEMVVIKVEAYQKPVIFASCYKPIIYGNNLVQQLSNCKKNLSQAECHHFVTVNLGLIENAKKVSEGKSVFITKQEEQA